MNRQALIDNLSSRHNPYDLIVIGGGATGLGTALDAAARGYDVVLLERGDFGGGTSSRSTKLIHGGVRYLKQGQISLVLGALRERERLLENAPHLVWARPFVIPSYRWWEKAFYGIGLKLYDAMARSSQFPPSMILSKEETLQALPNLKRDGLYGGVRYFDGQFDDARLAINLMQTLFEQGGTALNYMEVTGLIKERGTVNGVIAQDREGGKQVEIRARVVINATGVFTDAIRSLDDASKGSIIYPSQGVHIVLDRSFYPGESAMMIPKTDDGRVLFAVPWYNRVIIGTTDTPVSHPLPEPQASPEELNFLLTHAGYYLNRRPEPEDVKSIFTGLRPLVRNNGIRATKSLSRDHTLVVDPSGLVTITGGKWTTYRKMAEETVDLALKLAELPFRACKTATLRIHGHTTNLPMNTDYRFYGADEAVVQALAESEEGWGNPFHPTLTCRPCDVVHAVRHEMARTVTDVLSRRSRALFLDMHASLEIAPQIASLMASELGTDKAWEKKQVDDFRALTTHYNMTLSG